MLSLEDIYPLSPLQQGMLFQSLYAPEAGQHLLQIVCELSGPLDEASFQATWAHLLARHGALRASFVWEQVDEPLQVIHKDVAAPLTRLDWRHLDAGGRRDALEEFLSADRRRGFRLDQAPLLRLTLAQVAPEEHVLVWTCHHLLTDGWSLGLLLEECLAGYEAFSEGRTVRAGPVRPYRDYIAWLKQQPVEAAERFWRERLRGFTRPTPVPLAAPEPEGRGTARRYGRRAAVLTPALSERLAAFARAHALTLNTTCQGAWALLLSRYSGEREVLFGATVSGRPPSLPGVESMVGMFINTLPVRARVEPGVSLLSWLKQLQAAQAEAQQYAYSSLVQVHGWSELPRGQALFDTLLVFENYPRANWEDPEAGRLSLRGVEVLDCASFALGLDVLPGPPITLLASHDLDRLDGEQVARLLAHLTRLLEDMVARPEVEPGRLHFLPEEERRRLLFDFNPREAPGGGPAECIHEAFAQQVARVPDVLAVEDGATRLSYLVLDAAAERLAGHLRALGVGPEARVGLCAQRSCDAIIALLGILKAGGAYVPLDPSYPAERLRYMLDDAGVSVLVTTRALHARLPPHPARTVFLEDARQQGEAVQPHGSSARPEDAAYIMYTSGSTGHPKGVVVTHRGVVNAMRAEIDAFAVVPGSRTLQFASLSFDMSVVEIFTALLSGTTLCVAPSEVLLPGPELRAVLAAQRITHLYMTPSSLAALSSEGLSALRTVAVGGEVCTVELVARWAPGRKFLNAYGPTEAPIVSTITECVPSPRAPTIGRPIANTGAYVLDAHLEPVPIGLVGELFLAGAGVARGYLNRPELTAERFMPDPFSGRAGARMYRTGDLARWTLAGELEFMGRGDTQVKLRGFRIEPGEVESVLRRHPGVEQGAVIPREVGRGMELVAYVVPSTGALGASSPREREAELVDELRSFLRKQLPPYMVPASFVLLPSLPVNANGKLDRHALPAPEESLPRTRPLVPARTPTEKQLVAIWEEVLGRSPISVDDNIFELGGHSLLLLRIHSRVREAFGLEPPLASLFELVTVTQLAQYLEALRWGNQAPRAGERGEERDDFTP